MDRRLFLSSVAAGALGKLVVAPGRAVAQEKKTKADVETAVERGLEYLKKIQAQDGHWEAQGGQYPTTMTALAGMAMLMEGSTLREGKYSDQITKAVNWFLAPARQQPNGLIGNVQNPTESTRYMYGQGFGTMFLACVYGEEEDNEQRKKLEGVLTRAVDFIAKAQTSKKHRRPEGKEVDVGGWGYVSAADGNQFDEGSVTITALQGLRAARNAGIKVPKETVEKAIAYLDACTTPDGGIIYSYAGSGGVGAGVGQGRPPLTAAALACALSSGEFTRAIAVMNGKNPPKGVDRPSVVRWFENCRKNIPVAKGRVAHDEYQSYYFAQAVYALGDDRYGQLFPAEAKDTWLTWSKYKEVMYPYLIESQDKAGGGWTSGYIGPVFSTAVNLSILQLDKGILPIYQR
ncbi:MAG: hypothetical protein JWO38_6511 [Gemmataceae bacterium]|nr:hypothetical protein [Gemmataceae bacterium]